VDAGAVLIPVDVVTVDVGLRLTVVPRSAEEADAPCQARTSVVSYDVLSECI
jgi:hypothetical protein